MAITYATMTLSLPVVTIQHTYPELIREVQEGIIPYDKFWVSCYKDLEPSVHAKVHAELDDIDRNLVILKPIDGDVEISRDKSGNYAVACKPLGVLPTTVLTAVQEYQDEERSNPTRPHRITAFSVSPDSSRFATGYLDGSVYLYPTSPIKPNRTSFVPELINTSNFKTTSRPQLSSVTSLKFFPSSRVILSSGQDFSLTILPADFPDAPGGSGTRITPVRTMRAHTRPVTDTAIIAVGRNVVSSSLDGTIKLWDVSSGQPISSLSAQSAITSMSLGERMPLPPDGEEINPPLSTDDREAPETNSKVLFCGMENGAFELLDLGFKKSIFQSTSTGSPLTSIVYDQSNNFLATGLASGVVALYDSRSLATPITSFSRLQTAIEDLAFVPQTGGMGLAIATSDGLPYVAGVVPEGPGVSAELVGVDCDPVRRIEVRRVENRTEVWSASDDGIVRRYVL